MTGAPLSSRIRVLVVDDSVVVRRMVSEVLARDSAIAVVGSAANGKIALSKIPQVNPDIVTLDMEMPEMDGLQTLAAIRVTWPKLPVIMFSTLTRRGATATLDALALGASDYVTKPQKLDSSLAVLQHLQRELLPRIKALCPRGSLLASIARAAGPVAALGLRPPSKVVEVLAIGVSTGGPNALAEMIPRIPADFPVPIVIVQHMPPTFTRLLAERLTAHSSIKVYEATDGMPLEPGVALIAPGDYHMVVRREVRSGGMKALLNQDPQENSCRPAVDVLFRSVAEVYGGATLAVIMTGMGQDGLHGCQRIRDSGGQILVQDEATSVVWGMPGFVVNAGLADAVLPIQEIGPAIVRRTREKR